MNAIRIFQQPENGSITVAVPEELRGTLCEVIVMPAATHRDANKYQPGTLYAGKILATFTGTARFPNTVVGETDVYEQ